MLQSFAPLLGCGVMLLVCMGVMALAGNRRHPTDSPPPASSDEVAQLRAEVERLRDLDAQRRDAAEEAAP